MAQLCKTSWKLLGLQFVRAERNEKKKNKVTFSVESTMSLSIMVLYREMSLFLSILDSVMHVYS